jgi:sugar lactone lactonase YvrE
MTTSVAIDAGFISTVAGTGVAGYNGDGDSAEDARLYYPTGVAVNSAGTIFIADSYNRRVRSIEKDGVIRTVAGNGTAGSGGTGQATSAPMYPTEVVADDSGNLYVIDLDSQRVRLIKSDGVIVTVAGNGTAGYSGDGGQATGAQLYMQEASGVAVDDDGNLYIGDRYNHRVRMVKKDGTIKTLAGTGTAGFSGDGGRAATAQVSHPCGVAVDGDGNVYFADHANHRIRMVTRSGNIKTVAGTGSGGYSGDGQATSVQLNYPTGIAVDAKGRPTAMPKSASSAPPPNWSVRSTDRPR